MGVVVNFEGTLSGDTIQIKIDYQGFVMESTLKRSALRHWRHSPPWANHKWPKLCRHVRIKAFRLGHRYPEVTRSSSGIVVDSRTIAEYQTDPGSHTLWLDERVGLLTGQTTHRQSVTSD